MVLQTTVYEFNQGRASLLTDVHVAAAVSRHNVFKLGRGYGVRWCINKCTLLNISA